MEIDAKLAGMLVGMLDPGMLSVRMEIDARKVYAAVWCVKRSEMVRVTDTTLGLKDMWLVYRSEDSDGGDAWLIYAQLFKFKGFTSRRFGRVNLAEIQPCWVKCHSDLVGYNETVISISETGSTATLTDPAFNVETEYNMVVGYDLEQAAAKCYWRMGWNEMGRNDGASYGVPKDVLNVLLNLASGNISYKSFVVNNNYPYLSLSGLTSNKMSSYL